MLETVITCPLGSKCEEVIDGAIHRCAWYAKIEGQTSDGVKTSDSQCSLAWLPILQIDACRDTRGNTGSIDALRNIFIGAANANSEHKGLRHEGTEQ
jgi:hypothetical protein